MKTTNLNRNITNLTTLNVMNITLCRNEYEGMI